MSLVAGTVRDDVLAESRVEPFEVEGEGVGVDALAVQSVAADRGGFATVGREVSERRHADRLDALELRLTRIDVVDRHQVAGPLTLHELVQLDGHLDRLAAARGDDLRDADGLATVVQHLQGQVVPRPAVLVLGVAPGAAPVVDAADRDQDGHVRRDGDRLAARLGDRVGREVVQHRVAVDGQPVEGGIDHHERRIVSVVRVGRPAAGVVRLVGAAPAVAVLAGHVAVASGGQAQGNQEHVPHRTSSLQKGEPSGQFPMDSKAKDSK